MQLIFSSFFFEDRVERYGMSGFRCRFSDVSSGTPHLVGLGAVSIFFGNSDGGRISTSIGLGVYSEVNVPLR